MGNSSSTRSPQPEVSEGVHDTEEKVQQLEDSVDTKSDKMEDGNTVCTNEIDSSKTDIEDDTITKSQHGVESVEINSENQEDKNIVSTNEHQSKVSNRTSIDSPNTELKDDSMKILKHREESVETNSEIKEDKNTVCTNENQSKVPNKNSIDSSTTEIEDDKLHFSQHREESVENKSEKKVEENNDCANENQSKKSDRNFIKEETADESTFRATGTYLSQKDIRKAFRHMKLSTEDDKLFRYALEIIAKENQIELLHDVEVTIFFNTDFEKTIEHGKLSAKLLIYINKDGNCTYDWENSHMSRRVKGNFNDIKGKLVYGVFVLVCSKFGVIDTVALSLGGKLFEYLEKYNKARKS